MEHCDATCFAKREYPLRNFTLIFLTVVTKFLETCLVKSFRLTLELNPGSSNRESSTLPLDQCANSKISDYISPYKLMRATPKFGVIYTKLAL